jgi:CRISPR-associated protein Cas2
MTQHDFVISYDIADIKRLRKIAKCLEKNAFRIQKSVFFYPQATQADIFALVDELEEIIDQEEDDIRIYHVDVNNSIALESGIDLTNFNLVF